MLAGVLNESTGDHSTVTLTDEWAEYTVSGVAPAGDPSETYLDLQFGGSTPATILLDDVFLEAQ